MSFLGSLTGSTQRKDLRAAQTKANAALDQGYAQSQGYYDQAAGLYDPYMKAGGQAQTFYNDLLGLNGADARGTAQGVITSDPLWSGGLAQDQNAMLKYLNARGEGGGGKAFLAGQRVLMDNYGNWMDRYRDAGRQGLDATSQQSNVRMGQGDNAYGFAATRAGNAINYGNAMAQSRSIGVNNLLGALGTGINAYTGFSGGRR